MSSRMNIFQFPPVPAALRGGLGKTPSASAQVRLHSPFSATVRCGCRVHPAGAGRVEEITLDWPMANAAHMKRVWHGWA